MQIKFRSEYRLTAILLELTESATLFSRLKTKPSAGTEGLGLTLKKSIESDVYSEELPSSSITRFLAGNLESVFGSKLFGARPRGGMFAMIPHAALELMIVIIKIILVIIEIVTIHH